MHGLIVDWEIRDKRPKDEAVEEGGDERDESGQVLETIELDKWIHDVECFNDEEGEGAEESDCNEDDHAPV